MVQCLQLSTILATLIVPVTSRLTAGNDFQTQVEAILGNSDIPGSSYCTWSPDYYCYANGWPACCSTNSGSASCPSTQPPCDTKQCERGIAASKSCDDDEFCKLINSSTCPSTKHRTFKGICVPAGNIPCTAIWDPVCGCDGVTYGSECNANANRVDIKYEGECREEERSGEKACTKIYDPVCGCNGETYDNDCLATNAGVKICSKGTCEKECERGLGASMFCSDDEFCKLNNSMTCPSTKYRKFTGICVPAGEAVPCPYIMSPVCGCNGVTYDNDCIATAARVDIKHKGECKEEESAVE